MSTGNVEVADLIPPEVLVLAQVSGATDALMDSQLMESVWKELVVYDEFVIARSDILRCGVYATLVRLFYTDPGY
ncbi:MAG: hypothetical protein O7G86_20580 [Gammaproteobacteria bacterium]|nr:hypothetical protein [Gammaproteobacteria bacterium]MCZ6856319.1 hypothetical protein [Gammaproteobacteria bacterium]